ncbi:MAG: septum formation initiator family protein [Parcubacteria group bacterium]|jgi:cell division protein FtsB
MKEHKNIYGIFIKVGLLMGVVVLFFVVVAIYKEIVKKNQIQVEIDNLKAEAEKTTRENSILKEKIDFLSSREYMETEARDKLNLKSPEEKVVIVKKNVVKDSVAEVPKQAILTESKMVIANHLKWWNYFFKY